MSITVTYEVDKSLYLSPDITHNIILITTEYQYRNNLLVHIQLDKNLNIRLSSRFDDLLNGRSIPKEQFLFKKTYRQADSKPITRSTFNAKLSQFDLSQTAIEKEIIEDYAYVDKRNIPDQVRIAITERIDATTAMIDFKDIEQFENFSCPIWLKCLR